MPANHTDLEKRLWSAAVELRANSKLKSSEYSVPVLGLIFLRYADHKFAMAEGEAHQSGQRAAHHRQSRLSGSWWPVLPEASRFSNPLKLPEGADIGKAINKARSAKPRARANSLSSKLAYVVQDQHNGDRFMTAKLSAERVGGHQDRPHSVEERWLGRRGHK